MRSAQAGSGAVVTINWRRMCGYSRAVPTFRIREAAELLGVSDDTVRRWADAGRIPTVAEPGRPRVIDGVDLARFAEELAAGADQSPVRATVQESARNRFTGLVTRVVRDTVMAQVEIQSGPHRIVSLMSREAADELKLEPGCLAVASVKATTVVIQVPEHS
jgi:molybdopterin-binding protein